jgi:hypothetical protein
VFLLNLEAIIQTNKKKNNNNNNNNNKILQRKKKKKCVEIWFSIYVEVFSCVLCVVKKIKVKENRVSD